MKNKKKAGYTEMSGNFGNGWETRKINQSMPNPILSEKTTEEKIKKILMPLYLEVHGSIVEHLEKMFIELFDNELSQQNKALVEKVEGMKSVYETNDFPNLDKDKTKLYTRGYNQAKSDILTLIKSEQMIEKS